MYLFVGLKYLSHGRVALRCLSHLSVISIILVMYIISHSTGCPLRSKFVAKFVHICITVWSYRSMIISAYRYHIFVFIYVTTCNYDANHVTNNTNIRKRCFAFCCKFHIVKYTIMKYLIRLTSLHVSYCSEHSGICP